jgi:hypothetical protein
MTSIYKRIVSIFPEANQPSNVYDNVLLRTIKVPRNLMYVTEQLPSSTYDPPASTLAKALPNLKPAKRHTIDGIVNKAFS